MKLQFDSQKYTYSSKRKVIYGKRGMVCTSQPLAAQAGLDMLKKGGNAIDAAIAAAACLTVVEPTSNGLGSDAFALIWKDGKLLGLNASGMSPQKITVEKIKKQGYQTIPLLGWIPVTVPGAVGAWAELSQKHGKLPFETLLQPAIYYAKEGFAVTPTIARLWEKSFQVYHKECKQDIFDEWFRVFAPKGRAPYVGEIWSSKHHAKTLQELAETKCTSFYKGALADKIDHFSKTTGGYITKEDLKNYTPEWVEPISISYRGYDVWEIPPNGHGIVALMALNILNGYDIKYKECTDTYHKQIEAMKLAFEDGKRYVSDRRFMKTTVEQLLCTKYAEKRREQIGDTAILPKYGNPYCGGTVYLCTADEHGNMVSYIQSNYEGFGSGIVIPDTGIALHDRGANFSLDETMENCIAPCKRPYHTIIPGFLTKQNEAIAAFGVMGGFMQPQGHVQTVMNLIDFHMNPQQALDAPRWQWLGNKKIVVEREFPYDITEELLRKGHDISVEPESIDFGRGQMIVCQKDGVFAGATEPRADGTVAVW